MRRHRDSLHHPPCLWTKADQSFPLLHKNLTFGNRLVLFLWKLHKNCISATLLSNLTYGNIKPRLQHLHLVWKNWKDLEWWLLVLPSSLWGPRKLCCGDNSSHGEWSHQVRAAHTSATCGSHLLHPNWMPSCKDSRSQGMPDPVLLASWWSSILLNSLVSNMIYNSVVSLNCFN